MIRDVALRFVRIKCAIAGHGVGGSKATRRRGVQRHCFEFEISESRIDDCLFDPRDGGGEHTSRARR
ncbi:hypothetical protein EJB05_34726 [Eragrostis curvula]|uniref:Uncharacterized protein n=1 Tax=Eragrostis curvula TaxID=38414 RepID=A0A5J9U4L2_9POAL|nr:hypothetical protein EJB05_34726 [Eragrostis curvula]